MMIEIPLTTAGAEGVGYFNPAHVVGVWAAYGHTEILLVGGCRHFTSLTPDQVKSRMER